TSYQYPDGLFWAPDGSAFLSTWRVADDQWQIVRFDLATLDYTVLVSSPHVVQFPAWSPDGGSIVYTETVNDSGSKLVGVHNLIVIDADGSNQRALTNDTTERTFPVRATSWSPDGTQVVFEASYNDNLDIYTINAAGGANPTQLTQNIDHDFNPFWAPDNRIYFISDRQRDAGVFYTLYHTTPQGGDPVLVNAQLEETIAFYFSPDASRIVAAPYIDDSYVGRNLVVTLINGQQRVISTGDTSFIAIDSIGWQPSTE
ncbi:MAG: PD40 domain-containing protein, partial [Armatimonadetes bacterium]|nr:PD40 domain-containing protein [Anaerolineae bacterium]